MLHINNPIINLNLAEELDRVSRIMALQAYETHFNVINNRLKIAI